MQHVNRLSQRSGIPAPVKTPFSDSSLMKLIQFTDIHLTIPPKKLYQQDPNANFAAGLAHCLERHGDADALVISGDLTEYGEIETYERLRTMLADLPMPVALTIGNHDLRENFAVVFAEHLDPSGFAQSVFALPEGTGIIIDTVNPGSHAGALCATRLAWLREALAGAKPPVFLFMHHHPLPIHLEDIDRVMLADADAFGDIVETHREKIAHIFFGHIHLPTFGSVRGVPASASRGANQNGYPDYAAHRVRRGAPVAPAYTVVFADRNSVTVQMVEFGLETRPHIWAPK